MLGGQIRGATTCCHLVLTFACPETPFYFTKSCSSSVGLSENVQIPVGNKDPKDDACWLMTPISFLGKSTQESNSLSRGHLVKVELELEALVGSTIGFCH